MMIVWPEVMYDAAEFRALDEFLTLPPLPQDSLKIDLTKNCHVPTIPKNRFRVISSTLHTVVEIPQNISAKLEHRLHLEKFR